MDLRNVCKLETPALRFRAARDGVIALRRAYAALKAAGATRAAAKVRTALKSAEGALRHADNMSVREIDRSPCMVSMGCLCAGHARGNPANAPCDTREEA
jgi:hypothetical protein